MQNAAIYLIASLLVIFWGIGFFVYSLGAIIHLLLVVAVVSIVLRMMRRDRARSEREEKSAHDPKSAPP